MVRRLGISVFALVVGTATSAAAYDDTWYRAGFWPGEYPDGFTMTEDATIDIRSEPDPEAQRIVSCDFSKNATYHPWNQRRVEEQSLRFVSFTKVGHYEAKQVHRSEVYLAPNDTPTAIHLEPGDRWEFLAYLGEGMFMLRLNGKIYRGDQDLFVASTKLDGDVDSHSRFDEWLQLTCDNGTVGWLLMSDIEELPVFGPINTFDEYGSAADKTD